MAEFEYAGFFRLGDRPTATPWSLSNISNLMNIWIYGDPSRMQGANTTGMFAFVSPKVEGLDDSSIVYKFRPYAFNPFEVLVWRIYWAVGDYATIPANAITATINIGGTNYTYYIDYTYTGKIPFGLNVGVDEYGSGGTLVSLMADAQNTAPAAHGSNYEGKYLKGYAVFDLSTYVRGEFAKLCDNTWVAGNGSVDATAMVLCRVQVNMQVGNSGWFQFQNAVAQLQEVAEGEWTGVELISRTKKLMLWGGTHQTAVPEVTLLIWKDEQGNRIYEARRYGIELYGDVALVNSMLTNGDKIDLLGECVGGVCVKWVNDLGGVDCYVFPKTYRIQRKSKTKGIYNPMQDDTQLSHGNRRAYEIEESRVMHVGVDNVCNEDYKALLGLPYSAQIIYYDNDVQKWLECTVEDFDVTEKADINSKSFEIKLRLNDRNTQF